MGKFFLVIFFLLFCCYASWSQDPYHRIFNISDGLPSNEVHDIYIDSLNQIWFTTDRGVCIYDGYDIRTFTTSDGLSFNTNFKIIPDKNGRLWFTGYDGSLSYYEQGKFEKYIFNDVLKEELGTNWAYHLEVDDDGGIMVMEENIGQFGNFDDYLHIDSSSNLNLVLFENRKLANSMNYGIDVFNRKLGDRNLYYFGNILLPVLDYLELKNSIILGLNNNSYGAYRFTHKTQNVNSIIFTLKNKTISKNYETSSSIHDFLQDLEENILVCTSNGILLFAKGNLDSDPIVYFNDKTFTSIAQDQEGNYWASTLNNGLYFIPSFKFKSYPFSDIENIEDSKISTLEEIGDYLIIGSPSKKVYTLSSAAISPKFLLKIQPKLKRFHKNKNRVNIGENISLEVGNSGKLLKSRSLKKVKKENDQWLKIEFERSSGVKMAMTGIFVIFFDIDDNELFLDGNLDQFHRLDDYMGIDYIEEDLNQNLFFSDFEGIYTLVDNDYLQVRKLRDDHNFLDVRIPGFKIDKYNNKWIASIGNGLLCLRDNEEVIQYGIEDGVSSDIVQAVEFENDTTIWIGTNKGLDRLSINYENGKPLIKSAVNYNSTDGLTHNFILALKMWNDKLWIGTSNGLLSLDTDYNPISESRPTIEILSALVEPDSIDINSGELYDYDQNNIYISYNGISYRKPNKNFYSYALSKNNGTDRWIKTDQRELRITNLPHGDYSFKVKAQNKYKEWSDIKELKFSIKKHFAQTWWFRFLLGASILYFIYFLYQRRLVKELEKQRVKRTVEAARLKTEIAELTTFRNQFNPHFIFNLLNSIQNSIFKDDVKQANFYLSSFGNLMRKSLNLMSQKYVRLSDELDFLKSYLDLEFLRFPDKFEYRFEVGEDIIKEILLVPPLLIQPAIENVLKHAFNDIENGLLIVFITSVQNQKAINIKVTDNGSGMDTDTNKERDSFGLKIIEDRIKLLKIDFPQIDSFFKIHATKNSSGTIAEFQIPLIKKLKI